VCSLAGCLSAGTTNVEVVVVNTVPEERPARLELRKSGTTEFEQELTLPAAEGRRPVTVTTALNFGVSRGSEYEFVARSGGLTDSATVTIDCPKKRGGDRLGVKIWEGELTVTDRDC
jgi:hypothetical protein